MTTVTNPKRGGSIVRSEYMIDRFRVSFESGSAWHCACRDFAQAGACSHSREAAGMRAAQAQIVEHVATGRSQLMRYLGQSPAIARGAGLIPPRMG
jgi:hypothetical protein